MSQLQGPRSKDVLEAYQVIGKGLRQTVQHILQKVGLFSPMHHFIVMT